MGTVERVFQNPARGGLDSRSEANYIRGMRSLNEQSKSLEDASYRELRLLEEVAESPDLSQRQLAQRLGIALGVANLLVRNLAKKGYIKVTHLGWKRWVYVVTPKGMARKVHLTLGYIERFIDHYRRVRQLLRDDLSSLPLNEESRVAIIGTTEMAELTYLALRDLGVDEIEMFERSPTRPTFLGMRVHELESIEPSYYAKVVVAIPGDPDGLRDKLYASGVSESQLVELLRPRPGEPSADGHEEGQL
jgi:DNA-binding MarR family transcriptional regulator